MTMVPPMIHSFMTSLNGNKTSIKMRCLYFVSLYFLFVSCQSGKVRSVVVGEDVTAEGRIAADTTFDGLIKFFDTKTNQLIEERNYVKGIQSGSDVIYNKNGLISFKSEFANNKQNGYSYRFDSGGNLVEKSYNYYGLNVGGSAKYYNGSVKEFYFCDLDENSLMYLNYDSLKGRRFGDIQRNLFFFHESNYQPYDSRSVPDSWKTYFVYTPSPPKFDFKYSFVTIDSSFKVLSVLNEIGNDQPWSIVNIDWKPEQSNQRLALRVKIRDSINKKEMTAFRVVRF